MSRLHKFAHFLTKRNIDLANKRFESQHQKETTNWAQPERAPEDAKSQRYNIHCFSKNAFQQKPC